MYPEDGLRTFGENNNVLEWEEAWILKLLFPRWKPFLKIWFFSEIADVVSEIVTNLPAKNFVFEIYVAILEIDIFLEALI